MANKEWTNYGQGVKVQEHDGKLLIEVDLRGELGWSNPDAKAIARGETRGKSITVAKMPGAFLTSKGVKVQLSAYKKPTSVHLANPDSVGAVVEDTAQA